jgi:hypothetical protein
MVVDAKAIVNELVVTLDAWHKNTTGRIDLRTGLVADLFRTSKFDMCEVFTRLAGKRNTAEMFAMLGVEFLHRGVQRKIMLSSNYEGISENVQLAWTTTLLHAPAPAAKSTSATPPADTNLVADLHTMSLSSNPPSAVSQPQLGSVSADSATQEASTGLSSFTDHHASIPDLTSIATADVVSVQAHAHTVDATTQSSVLCACCEVLRGRQRVHRQHVARLIASKTKLKLQM